MSAHLQPVVLFDLDGTISDNSEGISTGMLHALDHLGISGVTAADTLGTIGPPLREVFAHFGVASDLIDDAVRVYRDYYHEHGWHQNVLHPGVVDVIITLAAHGRVVATATSKPEFSAVKIIEHFGLTPHLAYVGAASLDSTRAAKVDVVRHTLEVLGADAADAVMIGDRHHDVDGARAAGVTDVIGVTWGFGDRAELVDAGATTIVDTAAELANALGLSWPS